MSMFSDNPDFFPTPRSVARRMLAKVNKNAEYWLEPSAGKGDIADVIQNPCTYEEWDAENPADDEKQAKRNAAREARSFYSMGSQRKKNIDVIENYPALIQVLRGKEYDVVGFDWLTYEGVSYYDAIVMNPPFSAGAAHCLKAWDFLHNGEIVCLLNEETIKNPYTEERKRLIGLIEQFGNVEELGDCFSTAERKTDVRVSMVYLKKTAPDDTADLWAKTASQEKHHGVDYDGDVVMLAIRDNLGNMEHWFDMANQHWIKGIEHIRKAKLYMDSNKVTDSGGSRENDFATILKLALDNAHTCRAEYLRRHRKLAWTSVFKQMEFQRWLDSKQQDNFLRDVERDSTIPFTAENIKTTLENVFQSRKRLFDESVARVFDDLCGHAVENGSGPVAPSTLSRRWQGSEGWKTNDNYKVNLKLIFPRGVRYEGWSGFGLPYDGEARTIYSDLDRILCVLDGKPFADCYTVGRALESRCSQVRKETNSGGWTFESEYFEGRFFKKGTVHLKWKREDLWELFNKTAAAGKKWLGEETQQYRPTKRQDGHKADNWECRSGHDFVNGACSHCKAPQVDEVEAVACEWCRAIFEHTGVQHCPIHELPSREALPVAEREEEEAPEIPPALLALTAGESEASQGFLF